MPSFVHEAPLALLRASPELLPALLRDLAGVAIPRFAEAAVVDADSSDLRPVERRADLVVTLARAGGPAATRPVMGFVVEVQRRIDRRKQFVWPYLAASLHLRLRAPVCLVVFAATDAVARWAARPIDTLQVDSPFHPLVFGPSHIPRLRSRRAALRSPALAVLSALVHGNSPGGERIAAMAIEVAGAFDTERRLLCFDLLWGVLHPRARRSLEGFMQTGKYQYTSDFARKYFGQGEAKGKAEGLMEGKAESVLAVLAARRLRLSAALRKRVLACTDVTLLDLLVRRAVTVDRAADIFEE